MLTEQAFRGFFVKFTWLHVSVCHGEKRGGGVIWTILGHAQRMADKTSEGKTPEDKTPE